MTGTRPVGLRAWIARLHLILGLGSGAIVFVLGLTGCMYAFESELQDLVYPFRRVSVREAPFQPASVLRDRAVAALDGKPLDWLEYRGKDRAVEVQASGGNPAEGKPLYYWRLYLDPYTGALLAKQDMYREFFDTNLRLHMFLLLPDEIGKTVVGSAVAVFVVMLLSGIVLWWPRSRRRWREAFRVKWSAAPGRRTYDLHSVFGFYAAWLLLISAITGLAWCFEPVDQGLQQLAAIGEATPPARKSPKSRPGEASQTGVALDRAVTDALAAYPAYGRIGVDFPGKPTAALVLYVYPQRHLQHRQFRRYYDQYSGRFLGMRGAHSRSEQLEWAYYDLHVGKFLGLPGQLLAFFASLTAASLPVTGFLMWWSRRQRKRARQRQLAS